MFLETKIFQKWSKKFSKKSKKNVKVKKNVDVHVFLFDRFRRFLGKHRGIGHYSVRKKNVYVIRFFLLLRFFLLFKILKKISDFQKYFFLETLFS